MDGDRRIRRVTLEWDMCIAHELCVDACPEVFYIPDGEHAVRLTDDAERFFESHADKIRYAEWACPMTAIHVEYD